MQPWTVISWIDHQLVVPVGCMPVWLILMARIDVFGKVIAVTAAPAPVTCTG